MKTKIFRYIKEHRSNIDRNILSYIICVIIASILWFLNTLNKDYVSEISYPVKYTNVPKGRYIVSSLPDRITLEVSAKGFALLRYQISTSFLPIVIDINTYSNNAVEKGNLQEYTIQLNELKDKLSSQLNSDIKILSVKPEEIDFKFSYSKTKKIAIKPVVDYSLKKQYILKNQITAIPDSIEVSGPATVIDTLKYIDTKQWNAGEIGKNTSKTVDLVESEGLTFKENEVKLNIQIERFTEARKTISLQAINVPDSLNMRLFPANIEITFEIGLSMYDKVNDADFLFIVDYDKSASTSHIPVETVKVPVFIRDLHYSPQKVEFILEEK